MSRLKPIVAGFMTAFGATSALIALPAFAQDTQANTPQKIERVEVTGSNIKRINAETSSPVQIISREEIKRTGANSIRELVDSLSSSTGSLSDIGGSNSFASGASSASLRNLGKQSTLVLLNFRRVSPYALADYNEVFTNLDTLPLDAVDRVEILKNGASAIYGSDAVAGVINIITRKDYQGLQAQASREQSLTSSGKFAQTTASLTGGFGDLASDKYNVLANVELYKRDGVVWRDVLDKMNPVTKLRIPQTLTAQYSTYSYPGNVIGVGPVAGCEIVVSNLCRFDRYKRFEAQPEAERANMLLSGRINLGNDLEGFSELIFSRTKTTYISPFATYGAGLGSTVWGDPRTGLARVFTPRGLPAEHPLNPTGDEVEFRYRFVDAPAQSSPTSDSYRFITGLRGVLGNYDWESAVGILGSKTTAFERGALSDSGFREVIGDYTQDVLAPDFFNRPNGYRIGQTNSAEVLNKLFPEYGSTGKVTQYFVDGKLSGALTEMPAGPLGFATGFDLRREKFTIRSTDNLLAGDIVGFGTSNTDAARTYGAVFGELSIPLARKLEAQVAARVDKFQNVKAQVSPKLGLRYEPTDGILLRGTAETGFRAPNLTENAPSTKFAFSNGVTDPKRCPQALALSDALLAQADALPADDPNRTILEARADNVVSNECSAGVANIASFNPDLKPETSNSLSFGFVLEPVRGFNVSVDYWNIKRKNEIGIKGTQELLSAEGSLPPGSQISRGSLAQDSTFTAAEQQQYGVTVGVLNSVTNVFENVSRTKTSGFDIGLNSVANLPIGKLNVTVDATYLKEYRAFSTVINNYGDNLAGRYGYPRFTANLTASLKTGSFTNGFKIRHTGPTYLRDDYFDEDWTLEGCAQKRINANECRVATQSLLDYFFAYDGIKNLTARLYVRNVLGRLPPADLRELSEDGSNIIPQSSEDARRRTLKLSLEYKFF
jgi:iron complex outermembrane recepter protein